MYQVKLNGAIIHDIDCIRGQIRTIFETLDFITGGAG